LYLEGVFEMERRKFDAEFKREAVRLITSGGRKAFEVARDLGISDNLLHRWKQQYLEDPAQAFPGKGRLKPDEEELRRLKRQLADVTEERDILKKAVAIFSKKPR
jgi:transposase